MRGGGVPGKLRTLAPFLFKPRGLVSSWPREAHWCHVSILQSHLALWSQVGARRQGLAGTENKVDFAPGFMEFYISLIPEAQADIITL